ncbi:hypothetical protein CHOED_058 [Vibrio phage CHOED]|uniref:hypothetical protein n=1 Tax=Vibrio phage CHOED TaxID=1458716 RepID=UPI00042F4EC6|nr:hypothetical protein CHOED_058 [Vibrio phage CHOED]AHK11918.1 hypothetical protein CHOED_058 [Vibrio phage CHOED]
MSLNVLEVCRQGIAISSSVSVEKEAALGFPATIANLMAAKWKEVVAKDPMAQGIELSATDGRPNPMAMMLGVISTYDVTFRVYKLGTTAAAEDLAGAETEFHLWVGEDEDGNMVVAYNDADSSNTTLSTEDLEGAGMCVLRFAPEDFEELLELLGQDFSVLEDQAE